MKNYLLFILTIALFVSAKAAPGDLDTSFDGDGKVVTQIGGLTFTGNAVAIQTDGKILVAGTVNLNPGEDFAVVRYNANGSLDPTFDGDGLATTDIGGIYTADTATSIAIQADGKILVAGYSFSPVTDFTDFTIVRYNANGSLDISFDADGKTAAAVTTRDDFANSIALQTDGKILVGGTGRNDFAAVRYNSDGTLDEMFGAGGIYTIDVADGSTDAGTSINIQTDGKIVIAGYKRSGTNNDFAVVRILADGSDVDASFDADGIVITNLNSDSDRLLSAAIQTDGKIVAAGTSASGVALVRYNADGSLDSAFDTDGIVTTGFPTSSAFARAVKIQADGKIVAAGGQFSGNESRFILARYQTNGALDTSWESDGIVFTDFGSSEQANALAIQADGKIVAAGFSGNSIALARYFVSGSLSCSFQLDLSFGECGKVITDFGIDNDRAFDVAIQTDGKILVSGLIANRFGIARYNPNGSLDTSFDGDGYLINLTAAFLTPAISVAIQPDGKILALGNAPSEVNNGNDLFIVRYNADGSPDTNFGSGGSVRQATPYFLNPAIAVALQPNGKIVALAFSFSTLGGETAIVLSRYNSDGTPDAAFGTNGIALSFQGAASPTDLTLLPDGKIVVVGGINESGLVARYNPNGSLDTTFDGDGYLAFIPPGSNPGNIFVYSAASQPDGKILVGGYFNYSPFDPSNIGDSYIARFNSTGAPDTNFDGDGYVITSLPSDRPFVELAVQTNGKIIAAAGEKRPVCLDNSCGNSANLSLNFEVVRYHANGSLDSSLWGTGGIASSDFMQSEDEPAAFKIQPDGKIVVVGKIRLTEFGDTRFAIARYNGDLAPTAAGVSIAGQVLNGKAGISRVSVSLTDSSGATRTAVTNSFGSYQFTQIPAGQTYTVTVNHKKYVFNPNMQVLNVSDNLSGIDFTTEQ